jgi:hypothetical protein
MSLFLFPIFGMSPSFLRTHGSLNIMLTMGKHVQPALDASAFICPHCLAYAAQLWSPAFAQFGGGGFEIIGQLTVSHCLHCSKFALWLADRMIHPLTSNAPFANQDLPLEIRRDFDEARQILTLSPRGSAALLRLAIQKLCKHLGGGGENINADIGVLVKNGLPPLVQQALDTVRVVGNNAVHPGQLDLKDDVETASKLFSLVNIVAEVMISTPKHVQTTFQNVVPASQQAAIAKRDQP